MVRNFVGDYFDDADDLRLIDALFRLSVNDRGGLITHTFEKVEGGGLNPVLMGIDEIARKCETDVDTIQLLFDKLQELGFLQQVDITEKGNTVSSGFVIRSSLNHDWMEIIHDLGDVDMLDDEDEDPDVLM